MGDVALIGLTDARGWLLMQERDSAAPSDPDKWGLVGGGIEPGETPGDAARRELEEETGILRDDLVHRGAVDLPCRTHGMDHVELFSVRTTLTDADVECHEGRQIVFVPPERVRDLDLTDLTRPLLDLILEGQQKTSVPRSPRPRG